MTDLPAPAASPAAVASPAPRPRIRIGAVLWGAVLLAAGGGALWIATSPERRDAARDVVLRLDAFEWTIALVLVVGGAITLTALAAVIRSVQRRLSSGRRARSDAAPRPESP